VSENGGRTAVRVIFQIANGGRAVSDIIDAASLDRQLDGDWHVKPSEGYKELGVFNGRTFIGWHRLPQEYVDGMVADMERNAAIVVHSERLSEQAVPA